MSLNVIGYQFDNIILDLKNRQIRRAGKNLVLNTKYFDVLVYLVSRHHQLTTREQIFQHIWGDVIVTDTALSQCIKDIRKVLDDKVKNPSYIKTIPKQGFMFIKEPKSFFEDSDSLNGALISQNITKRPYKFLDFYAEEDADLFFGRNAEIQSICSKILTHRSLILYGRSGVGKSSIVHAGVLPTLRDKVEQVFVMRSYQNPLQEIMQILFTNRKEGSKIDVIELFKCAYASKDQTVILIFDQFEEFFTRTNQGLQEEFIELIGKIFSINTIQLKVLFVIREDLFAEMSRFKKVFPEVFHHEYRLQRLDQAHAKLAITEPAKKVGCEVEEQLVQNILKDLSDKVFIDPPQLQIVCDALYDLKSSDLEISLESYDQLGGASQILSKYLERVIQRYHQGDMDMAKTILTNLISIDNQRLIVPITKLEKEIRYKFKGTDKIHQLISDLVKARVLRYSLRDGETLVELTHDFLIPEIARWQSEEIYAVKQAQAVIDRAIENYKSHRFLMDLDMIDLILPLGDKLHFTDDEADLMVKSMLIRGCIPPKWLIEKSPKISQLIQETINDDRADIRVCAIESAALKIKPKLKSVLTDLALWDPDLMVRKTASIVLAEKYSESIDNDLLNKEATLKAGIVRKAVSLAFIRDHNKQLCRVWQLPLTISLLVLFGLMWIRLRRNKELIFKETLGGGIGAALSGLFVGILLGITLVFYRQAQVYESTTLLLVLSSLGTITGLLAGLGISFGMSAMRYIGYRHSRYWCVVGAILGGGLVGGISHIIGVDTLQALFGQDLSGIAGAYEGAFIGLGLSIGYFSGDLPGQGRPWIRVFTAALGAMLAAIFLTLIKGNLFSASIEIIAHSFVNSQINLQPLANLFGEAHFGQISRLILGAVEGFLFGGFLVLGMEFFRRKHQYF
jgi:DNA-binding winged helix-turn-helix (wHTH) protein